MIGRGAATLIALWAAGCSSGGPIWPGVYSAQFTGTITFNSPVPMWSTAPDVKTHTVTTTESATISVVDRGGAPDTIRMTFALVMNPPPGNFTDFIVSGDSATLAPTDGSVPIAFTGFLANSSTVSADCQGCAGVLDSSGNFAMHQEGGASGGYQGQAWTGKYSGDWFARLVRP
jgi:hypothetical protein